MLERLLKSISAGNFFIFKKEPQRLHAVKIKVKSIKIVDLN